MPDGLQMQILDKNSQSSGERNNEPVRRQHDDVRAMGNPTGFSGVVVRGR